MLKQGPKSSGQQKKGLLDQKKTSAQSIDPEIYKQINNISRRLRIAEENYSGLRRKTQLTDQTILKTNRDNNTEIRAINSDIKDLRRDIKDMNDKLDQIAKEMKLFAKKEQVKVIQRYVNSWDPMRFVTPKQVEQIVKDMLEENEG